MKSSRLLEFRPAASWSNVVVGCGRAAVTGTLCALLVGQPIIAEAAVKKTVPVKKATEIQGQERVLHALNRLTFGPRPGDVAAVEKMGLQKWFEQQLNPAAIDDSALEARLADYPAMNLPLGELQRKYPGQQTIKALAEGNGQLPADPMQRAMVQDQVAFYKQQRKVQAAAAPPMGAAGMDGGAQGDMAMAAAPAAAGAKKGKRAQAAADASMMAAGTGDAAPNSMAMPGAEKPIPAADLMSAPAPNPDGPDRAAMREQVTKLMELAPADRFKAIMALSPNQILQLRPAFAQAGGGQQPPPPPPQGQAPAMEAGGMRAAPAQGRPRPDLTAGMTPEQREMLGALGGSQRMIALEDMESRLTRDIYSDRQLEAVITDFWLNHFNVFVGKNQNEPFLIPSFERETIRPNALGNFETLLVATAKSPAMLEYLDNFRSVGPDSLQAMRLKKARELGIGGKALNQASLGLNENYGRELMELHTLGVNGGYTQADVTMVAKVFTGWGLDRPYQGGDFQFEERRHEPGPKTVLGTTIDENGEHEGLEVLHMLATSPATAHFISTKLAIRFVSDNPPASLVDKMAASFLKSNGDIKTVLRTMFDAPEFWSTDAYRAKVKTPEEFVISALRASGAQVTSPQALVQSLNKLGQPLYGMQTPNGYSWMKDGWVSTGALVSRMNFSLVLTGDRIPGVRVDWTELLGEKPAGFVPAAYTPSKVDPTAAKEKRLEQILLGMPVSDRTRATVIGQSNDENVTSQAETQFDLGGGGKGQRYLPKGGRGQGVTQAAPDDAQAAVMAGLLLGSPEFQRR
jgi:uncharacterized protein (DUF1800 family)